MNDLPAELVAVLPECGLDVARQWWSALSETDRQRIAGLWDERLEVQFFTPQSDDQGHQDEWEKVPTAAGGRFMPRDDDGGVKEWGPGYFEYLLLNPDLVMAYEPVHRTFHIGCTQHSAARACITSGKVPSDFQCPFESAACPMEPLSGAKLMQQADRQITAAALASLDQTFDMKAFLDELKREDERRGSSVSTGGSV